MTRTNRAALFLAALLSALPAEALFCQSRQEGPAALEARAQVQLGDIEDWGDAADLYRQAAELRGPADAKSVVDLRTAGRLEYYQGSDGQAIRDMNAAGELALAMGDVVSAANAFTDAAWIAGTTGRGEEARALAKRAQLLTHSPLITQAERSNISSRLPLTGL